MPRSPAPILADQLPPPTPPLPGSLQEAWQHIANRLEQAGDWSALERRTAHAQGWGAALSQAQVIDLDTFHALVRVREDLHARVTQRLLEAEQ
ncbi:hypothetical protein BK660_01595 [Pseudomonas brassicacearum]|jgi:hypothetical protein|uniref:Uncharacterized protein n=1 Tax=Pseudomonas brassicacearum TaxID=930166 RepID=A0A423IG20_9PSED|nr:hypothetical protein [Pseudomonas brassicacearum]RON24391.1 hypothetical protein BK660_01595 [Pseudomonas brassicacearum]